MNYEGQRWMEQAQDHDHVHFCIHSVEHLDFTTIVSVGWIYGWVGG
jgi:hypothetical protein